MSATNAPFGLRPAFHPSGLDRATALVDGITSGYGSAILKGQPVKYVTGGVIQPAAAGDAFVGAFAGVEFTDTTGRHRVSNNWPASTAYQTGSCTATSTLIHRSCMRFRLTALWPKPRLVTKLTSATPPLVPQLQVCRSAPCQPHWLA